jgi:signal transduction histidine kinase
MITRDRLPRIWSTPLRLTVILLVIFAMASLGCFATAFLVVRANLNAAILSDIQQTVDTLRLTPDPDELREHLADAVATTDPAYRIMHYLPDQGPVISNAGDVAPISGFAILPDRSFGATDVPLAKSYQARSLRIGDGQLIVAQSRSPIIEIAEVFAAVLVMGLLPAIGIAVTAGLWVARGAQHRIETIQTALSAITSGQTAARVHDVDGRHDDLSGIGQAVNEMAAAQEALIVSMQQVSSDIAHDLKTPIQRVSFLLDQVMTKTDLSDAQEVLLLRAKDETAGIVRTFQALLQLAQIEGGAARDRLTAVDLADVARDVVDFLEVDAEAQGLSMTADLGACAIVAGDRQLLSQLLVNLIHNAMLHGGDGGTVQVVITAGPEGITLVVADRGPGIPEHERGKVLQRLYRLERSRTANGNGLGLALVAAVCNLHRAHLTLADNAPGLAARIDFPLLPSDTGTLAQGPHLTQ